MSKVFLIFEVFLLLHYSKGIYILNNIYSYVHLKNGFLASIFKGVRIGFGEVDYSVSEGNGKAVVLVTQAEPITENLTVPIVAITYEEFFGSGRTLPSDFDDVELPNPAECMCNNYCSNIAIGIESPPQVLPPPPPRHFAPHFVC